MYYTARQTHKHLHKSGVRDPSRHAICGVLLDPCGLAVATDGRQLAVRQIDATDKSGNPGPAVIVPPETWQRTVGKCTKTGTVRFREHGGDAHGRQWNVGTDKAPTETSFAAPDPEYAGNSAVKYWASVVPQIDGTHHVTLNARLLFELARSLDANNDVVTLGLSSCKGGDFGQSITVLAMKHGEAKGNQNKLETDRLGVLMTVTPPLNRCRAWDDALQKLGLKKVAKS